MTDNKLPSIDVPIAAYAAWAPGVTAHAQWQAWADGRLAPHEDGTPDLPFVAPLSRRRLSRSARMMLWVTHQTVPEGQSVRTVFASRHGELHRTVPMLRDLARDAELSPAEFSLSVHNAAAGVNSIVRGDRSPSTSIAAGEESFGYALLEAAVQWRAAPQQPVLAVYADEPAPVEYRRFLAAEPVAHAVAFMLSSTSRASVRLSRRSATPDAERSDQSLSLAFLRAWVMQRDGSWCGARDVWSWEIVRGDA